MLYVPEGCAHGYLTLTDSAEVRYLTSQYYAADAVGGVRYDDAALGIEWPREVAVVSEQDLSWPLVATPDTGPFAVIILDRGASTAGSRREPRSHRSRRRRLHGAGNRGACRVNAGRRDRRDRQPHDPAGCSTSTPRTGAGIAREVIDARRARGCRSLGARPSSRRIPCWSAARRASTSSWMRPERWISVSRSSLEAIEHAKHVVLVNAELDATLGPVLKARASAAGVVITNTDGDEPGVTMNLFRYVSTIGLRPGAGRKHQGIHRSSTGTPETQRAFAESVGQGPKMITSFADGTKLSMETTLVANATGFGVAQRGMRGHRCDHVKDVLSFYETEELLDGGYVDYVLGAQPGTGAFVVGHSEHPVHREYLGHFKMGDGPFYVFYTPWHLPQAEACLTAARAAIFHDASVTPLAGPPVRVVTIAKRDLRAGRGARRDRRLPGLRHDRECRRQSSRTSAADGSLRGLRAGRRRRDGSAHHATRTCASPMDAWSIACVASRTSSSLLEERTPVSRLSS